MLVTPRDLDAFVAGVDERGGPESPEAQEYWKAFHYVPETKVSQHLDPYGEAYVAQQIALYRELSGRELDQQSNEHTALDFETYLNAINPYNHPQPSVLGMHMARIASVLSLADIPRDAHVLDMGPGWGLTSELFAYSGLKVTGLDINNDFVNLINARARKSGLPIRAIQSTFEEIPGDECYDAVAFYECLHHAVRPWVVIEKCVERLKPGGRIMLAGEPINSYWWKHWGMRLDPISVYCIRKFGWFESGWSLEFMTDCLTRHGLNVRSECLDQRSIGWIIVGTATAPYRSARFKCPINLVGHYWAEEAAVALGDRVVVDFHDKELREVELSLMNHRQSHIRIKIDTTAGRRLLNTRLCPGLHQVPLDLRSLKTSDRLIFSLQTWCPNDELRNGDARRISLHLKDLAKVA